MPPELSEPRGSWPGVADGLTGALEDLRELSRGIHPAVLSEGGLVPALKALARRSAIPVELEADILSRLPEPVEVAAYYVVSEALANTEASTPTRRWSASRSGPATAASSCRWATTASVAPRPGGAPASSGSPTGSRLWWDHHDPQPHRPGHQDPDRPAGPGPPFQLAGTERCRSARSLDGALAGQTPDRSSFILISSASRTAQLERSPGCSSPISPPCSARGRRRRDGPDHRGGPDRYRAVQPTQPTAAPHRVRRAHARPAAGRARPDDRRHRAPDDRRRPRGPEPPVLGGHRLSADLHRGHPAVGKLSDLYGRRGSPGRDRHLPGRLDAVRPVAEHG